jgi:hypothetical protein
MARIVVGVEAGVGGGISGGMDMSPVHHVGEPDKAGKRESCHNSAEIVSQRSPSDRRLTISMTHGLGALAVDG